MPKCKPSLTAGLLGQAMPFFHKQGLQSNRLSASCLAHGKAEMGPASSAQAHISGGCRHQPSPLHCAQPSPLHCAQPSPLHCAQALRPGLPHLKRPLNCTLVTGQQYSVSLLAGWCKPRSATLGAALHLNGFGASFNSTTLLSPAG